MEFLNPTPPPTFQNEVAFRLTVRAVQSVLPMLSPSDASRVRQLRQAGLDPQGNWFPSANLDPWYSEVASLVAPVDLELGGLLQRSAEALAEKRPTALADLAAALRARFGPAEALAQACDARIGHSRLDGMVVNAAVLDVWFAHLARFAGVREQDVAVVATAHRSGTCPKLAYLSETDAGTARQRQLHTWVDVVHFASTPDTRLHHVSTEVGRQMAEWCGAEHLIGWQEPLPYIPEPSLPRLDTVPEGRDLLGKCGRRIASHWASVLGHPDLERLVEEWRFGNHHRMYTPELGGLRGPVPDPWVRLRRALTARQDSGDLSHEQLEALNAAQYAADAMVHAGPAYPSSVVVAVLHGCAPGRVPALLDELGYGAPPPEPETAVINAVIAALEKSPTLEVPGFGTFRLRVITTSFGTAAPRLDFQASRPLLAELAGGETTGPLPSPWDWVRHHLKQGKRTRLAAFGDFSATRGRPSFRVDRALKRRLEKN